MKDYKRLTEMSVGSFKYCLKDHNSKVGEFNDYDAFFDYSMAIKRLGELEDKIERGELCDRKETAKEIFDHIREYAIKDNCIIWRVYFSDLEEIAKQFGVEVEE